MKTLNAIAHAILCIIACLLFIAGLLIALTSSFTPSYAHAFHAFQDGNVWGSAANSLLAIRETTSAHTGQIFGFGLMFTVLGLCLLYQMSKTTRAIEQAAHTIKHRLDQQLATSQLHRFRIVGTDRETGMNTELTVKATSAEHADQLGRHRGIQVSRIESL